jgi:hypothetical protein
MFGRTLSNKESLSEIRRGRGFVCRILAHELVLEWSFTPAPRDLLTRRGR